MPGIIGNSTTASLIAHMLSQKFSDVRLVGNIGSPMLDHLDGATNKTIFVIELSSHQLEDCRYSPQVAVLLDIMPEHLDYYGSFSAYKKAKSNIVRFQTKADVVFFHPGVRELADISPGKKLAFGKSAFSSPNLSGNIINMQAAFTVAKHFGITKKLALSALQSFRPLPHRLEFVGEYRGIKFYNDSLATIPQATIHALEALGSDVETLVAGGFDRGLDYSILGEYLGKHPVKTLILFPDTGKKIHEAMRAYHVSRITYHFVKSMEEAVRLAYRHTPRGKICLLSPASASFNLFADYADRGNQFAEWVRALGHA